MRFTPKSIAASRMRNATFCRLSPLPMNSEKFAAHAAGVHYFARRHRDFGRVYAIGAEHRAAAALRALVKIAVPFIEHGLAHVARADQPGEIPAGKRVVAPGPGTHWV